MVYPRWHLKQRKSELIWKVRSNTHHAQFPEEFQGPNSRLSWQQNTAASSLFDAILYSDILAELAISPIFDRSKSVSCKMQWTHRYGVIVPPSNLSQNLAYLLESGKGADITFVVKGEIFKAHRCVLAARSDVFNATLFGYLKEK